MEQWSRVLLLCVFAVPCSGQTQPGICPKHIESPTYPQLARMTRLMGQVTLSVTVDAEGRVQGVVALPGSGDRQAHKLLRDSAIENMWHWTFSKPPTAPYSEVIVYDYDVDPSLPPSGGLKEMPALTKVVLDLPDHVRISMNSIIVNPSESKERP